MSDKDDGDPTAVRHLRPDVMPGYERDPLFDIADDEPDDLVAEIAEKLVKLREPFPPEHIEKRPQPAFKDAWKDKPRGNCPVCGGYHCLSNAIHLDYIGHALVNDRLLQVDPFWTWEPMAVDQDGLPKFDRFGGLWIKLTICGVTRPGYGDAVGKDPSTTAVKEIIGDALRNGAMRFGVALDLWSKIDRQQVHEEARETPRPQRKPGRKTSRQDGKDTVSESDKARSKNQDALDELASICTEHEWSLAAIEARYNDECSGPELLRAHPDDIREFGQRLLQEADQIRGRGDGDTESVTGPTVDETSSAATEAVDDSGRGGDEARQPDEGGPLF